MEASNKNLPDKSNAEHPVSTVVFMFEHTFSEFCVFISNTISNLLKELKRKDSVKNESHSTNIEPTVDEIDLQEGVSCVHAIHNFRIFSQPRSCFIISKITGKLIFNVFLMLRKLLKVATKQIRYIRILNFLHSLPPYTLTLIHPLKIGNPSKSPNGNE